MGGGHGLGDGGGDGLRLQGGQQPAIQARGDHLAAEGGGDHRAVVSEGLQLGDGEAIGEGGQDHGVGTAVEPGHLGAGDGAEPADVGGSGPGLGIKFAGAGEGEPHGLALQQAHGLQQTGDALAQANGAAEEQLEGAGRCWRGRGTLHGGLVHEGNQAQLAGRHALAQQATPAPGGIHHNAISQLQLLFPVLPVLGWGGLPGGGEMGVAAVFGEYQPLLLRAGVHLAEHTVVAPLTGQAEDGAGGIAVAEHVERRLLEAAQLTNSPALKPDVAGDGAGPAAGRPGAAGKQLEGQAAELGCSYGGCLQLRVVAGLEALAREQPCAKGKRRNPGVGEQGLEQAEPVQGAGHGVVLAGADLQTNPITNNTSHNRYISF